MVEIKKVSIYEVERIKERHILRCFTDYLYHQHAVDEIQKELDMLNEQLLSGGVSSGFKTMQKYSAYSPSPWQLELLTKEHYLVKEQDQHIEAIEKIDTWLYDVDNPLHKDIIIAYLINNQCSHAESVAETFFTTSGNVCKITKRFIKRLAKNIK